MRQADRPVRRHSSRVRHALGAVAVLAVFTLLAQIGHHFRDAWVARWPAARAVVEPWCRLVGCRIEAPRAIDAVTLESSALLRLPALDAFRLAVTLRSRGRTTLSMPSVDLRLTDSTGQLVARRALSPRELGAPASLQPGAELALEVLLAVRDPRVTGYTVEVFYP
jgi:hypothetical protein